MYESGRGPQKLALLLVAALIAVGVTTSGWAASNPKYAAIVINGFTEEVLFSRSADARRYPASLTKVMTLYLLFDALERGDVTLNTKMRVSKRAAGQAPSKLGLRAGSTIIVEHAIKTLVVRSANDVAVVVAEHLGKTESQFAQIMTRKAKALGMNSTQFRNASGLPNRNQYTTARDIARLSFRLISDHPKYYPYFKTKSIRWGGKTYKSHNAVLKNFDGTDGIKTGYIRASGFNLATSTRRNGYHLIGVVFGGRTTKTRDAHMREILNEQFARINSDPSLGRRYVVIPSPVHKPVPGQDLIARAQPGGTALQQVAIAPETETIAEIEPAQEEQRNVRTAGQILPIARISQPSTQGEATVSTAASSAATASVPAGSADPIGDLIAAEEAGILGVLPASKTPGGNAPSSDGSKSVIATAMPNRSVTAAGIERRLSDPDAYYGVQIGVFGLEDVAIQRLNAAATRAPEILQNVIRAVVPVEVDNRTIYRARIGPYREVEAESACGVLQQRGVSCFTVVQQEWSQGSN
jgi:D-alanyl-D-alanine carboxypeptidase